MEVRSSLLYSVAHDDDSKQQQSGTVVDFAELNLLGGFLHCVRLFPDKTIAVRHCVRLFPDKTIAARPSGA